MSLDEKDITIIVPNKMPEKIYYDSVTWLVIETDHLILHIPSNGMSSTWHQSSSWF